MYSKHFFFFYRLNIKNLEKQQEIKMFVILLLFAILSINTIELSIKLYDKYTLYALRSRARQRRRRHNNLRHIEINRQRTQNATIE